MYKYEKNSIFEPKWGQKLTEKEREEYVLKRLETLHSCSLGIEDHSSCSTGYDQHGNVLDSHTAQNTDNENLDGYRKRE